MAELCQEVRHVVNWRWLLLLFIAMVFHGCHLGGHDDDLLKTVLKRPLHLGMSF